MSCFPLPQPGYASVRRMDWMISRTLRVRILEGCNGMAAHCQAGADADGVEARIRPEISLSSIAVVASTAAVVRTSRSRAAASRRPLDLRAWIDDRLEFEVVEHELGVPEAPSA